MVDLIVRNARLASAPEAPPCDIAVADGMIVAVQPEFRGEAPSYDAHGRLTCGGLVETQATAEKGSYTRKQLGEMLDYAEKGIRELLACQQTALQNAS